MSDFLSNLVERTLTATGAVRPRTGSIFEPPPVNGGAFFRDRENTDPHASERHDQEPDNRLSRLKSLWRTTSPETEAGQFVSAPPNTGFTSLQIPSAPSLVREHLDPSREQQDTALPSGDRANAEGAKTGEEEPDSSRPESPGTARQMRPRANVRDEDQTGARSSRDRATRDLAKTGEEGADSSRSESTGPSPRVWPLADVTRKQQAEISSTEHRGSADAVGASPQGRRADHPGKQPSRAPLQARHTDPDRADEKGADELQTQLAPEQASSPRGPLPRHSTNKHSDEMDSQKIIALGANERGLHRELVPGRDVRAVSPRPPSSRPLPAPRSPKNTPAPPSINVTIGRVEVRATLPPRAPSQSPRATSPIMNLEEYLRQRAGGNRS